VPDFINGHIIAMEVRSYIPHQALHDYVLNIFTVDVSLSKGISDVVTPFPPFPFQSLMFYCNNPISMGRTKSGIFEKQPMVLLTGPQVSRVNVMVHQQLRSIRVDFLPGGLFRLLGIPMHEMLDGGFDAVDFFGSGMRELREQLHYEESLEAGKNLVEAFLLGRAGNLKEMLPFDHAMQAMLNPKGPISIEKIAALSCLSLKQFERKCQERIGMNPKMYARILRFSKAYSLREAQPQLRWTEIAYQAGYYDQMHMIRDFKVFAGVSPSVIEEQLLSTPLRMQRDTR
jgi:AraC-like DNA-binding protein